MSTKEKSTGLHVPEQNHIPPMPPVKPAACEVITIPVSEYIYLQRIDAFMDVLLQADNYNNNQVVAGIRKAVLSMRNPGEGGAYQ